MRSIVLRQNERKLGSTGRGVDKETVRGEREGKQREKNEAGQVSLGDEDESRRQGL